MFDIRGEELKGRYSNNLLMGCVAGKMNFLGYSRGYDIQLIFGHLIVGWN